MDVPELSLSKVQIDIDDVVQYIQTLDVHEVMGISTWFVKASPYSMTMVLTKLSVSTCTFPGMWKTAIVTPVQKSKLNSSLSNYRLISVLPSS